MAKRGKLSKIELYYIEGNTNLPAEDIAQELDRSVELIQKKLDEFTPPSTKTVTSAKNDNEPQMFKVMGRHERNGQKVATVMTEAASALADSSRPNRTQNKKIQAAIHKPRG